MQKRKMKKLKELWDTGTIKLEKPMKVKELLKELNLWGKNFGILINGKLGKEDDELKIDDEIVILPAITGG